jgi:hypothetical protein
MPSASGPRQRSSSQLSHAATINYLTWRRRVSHLLPQFVPTDIAAAAEKVLQKAAEDGSLDA